MTRPNSRLRPAIAALLFAVVCTLCFATGSSAQEPSSPIAGRLATVEPSTRRITIIPIDEVDLVEMFIPMDGELLQGEEPLTLSELVIQVGRRVTVHVRYEADRRIAHRIIVEPD